MSLCQPGRKSAWSCGFYARLQHYYPHCPQYALRWSDALVDDWWRMWNVSQRVSSPRPAGERCLQVEREDLAPIGMFRFSDGWGLTSALRDIGLDMIWAVLHNRTFVFGPNHKGYRQYCKEGVGRFDDYLGCFYTASTPCMSNGLTAVETAGTAHNLDPMNLPDITQTTAASAWFTPEANQTYVWFENETGRRITVREYERQGGNSRYPILSMLRSLLGGSLQHGPELKEAENALAVAIAHRVQHPMLVLQIRRTDKAIDHGATDVRARFPNSVIPYSVYADMIREIEENVPTVFRSVFLMSDDVNVWIHRKEWLTGFQRQDIIALVNPYWDRYAEYFRGQWLSDGHMILGIDSGKPSEPDITEFHRNMLADIDFGIEHGDFLLGCGASGVSQLIAQGLGRKFQVDGSWLALWEEDHLKSKT